MSLPNRLMAPICAVAAIVAGAPTYPEEPAAKVPSAEQSAAAPVSATTATPTAATPPAAPQPVDRKKALQFGFRPGVVNGIPVFCKEVPIEGTRFTNKRCVRENQFSAFLSQLQIARDAAMKSGCYGADFCGNVESMPGKPRMSMGNSR
jgi:hypothetical protein